MLNGDKLKMEISFANLTTQALFGAPATVPLVELNVEICTLQRFQQEQQDTTMSTIACIVVHFLNSYKNFGANLEVVACSRVRWFHKGQLNCCYL